MEMSSEVEVQPRAGDAEGLQDLRAALAARMAGRYAMSMDERRASFDRWITSICPLPADVRVAEAKIAGVPVLEIEPKSGAAFNILHIHGGAFVSGSPRTHMEFAARLARHANARVVLPHYRLAPEHKFPAAVEDADAVTREVMRRNPARPLALSGDSAGGNLAINAIVETGAKPAALALQSPFVDLAMTAPSIDARATLDPFMSREGLGADVGRYLPAGIDVATPRLSPLFANLAVLPPTLIQVGTAEILFDDAMRLTAALQTARVPVTCERWLDMTHDWHLFPNWLPSADAATRSIAKFLRQHAGA